ncbi:MAG TPA: TauD/TfdA family dioxygenase [Xanthobacteraceae bacterium]|nr:TauD/TfdA family dioxygenase [Xanthobacteraceae bacterium]
MPYQTNPLHPSFGAEIIGLDLTQPVSTLPVAELKAAIDTYGVVVYRNPKPLSDEQHVAFSALFGPVEVGPMFKIQGDKKRIDNPALVDVGNLDADGNIMKPDNRRMLFRKGDRLWHADMSFHHNRATYSLLLGHEIPPPEAGGDTLFADMRAAYDALPQDMKVMIENLTVEHSIWHSRALAGFPEPTQEELDSRPPARHKLVHMHASGRKSLYIASHASHIVGWPVDLGRGLIKSLMKFATQPQFVYRHQWRLGDLLMWDNLSTMHRATDFEDTKYRRDMRRATCRERPVDLSVAA